MHREVLGNSRCIFYRMTDKQLLRTELRSKCGYFYPHYHKSYFRYTNAGSPSSPTGTFTVPWISGRA